MYTSFKEEAVEPLALSCHTDPSRFYRLAHRHARCRSRPCLRVSKTPIAIQTSETDLVSDLWALCSFGCLRKENEGDREDEKHRNDDPLKRRHGEEHECDDCKGGFVRGEDRWLKQLMLAQKLSCPYTMICRGDPCT